MSSDGFTIWLTGLPCSGKSTIAQGVADAMRRAGWLVEVLDGDAVRQNLSSGLGFSREDRDKNVQRISFVAGLLARNGVVAIVAAVSPYRTARNQARETLKRFVEVHVGCPRRECERRDVKGMYKKARSGALSHFTGIDDPYEPPEGPEVALQTDQETSGQSIGRILCALIRLGYTTGPV